MSHAEREQVIDALEAAFVRGMLAKDEFDLRVSQTFALRTYAELAAVTADLPAGPIAASAARGRLGPGRVASSAARPGDGGGDRALCRRAGVRIPRLGLPVPRTIPRAKIALFLSSNPMYLLVLLICVVCLIAGRRGRRSSGRPPRRPAPGAGGQATRCRPRPGPGGELPPGRPR